MKQSSILNHPILTSFSSKMQALYKDDLQRIILFGSHARGEATEESDIDLLILLSKQEVNAYDEIPKITEEVFGLNIQYNQVLFYLPMSIKRWQTEESFLLDNIRKDGVAIWERKWNSVREAR
ncbi:MAG: nucleotidyltransferase domain-containing protein [Bacteroidota bacterium]